jgi:hypothetical protein
MNHIIQPFHLLVIALAGWFIRHQQALIDYLNRRESCSWRATRRAVLRFTDVQQIKLAVNARVLGQRLLDELKTHVTPDTLIAWQFKLIAKK